MKALNGLMRHDWVTMPGTHKGERSCSGCGMRKYSIPGGPTRYTDSNGSCADSFTVDEPSCSGAPADYGVRS